MRALFLAALILPLLVVPGAAQILYNVTTTTGATATMGLNNYLTTANNNGVNTTGTYSYSTNGVVRNKNGNPGIAALTDASMTSFDEDEVDGGALGGQYYDSSYIQYSGGSLASKTILRPISEIKLTFALNQDGQGGFFGDNNGTDISGGTIHLPSTLVLDVQITRDGANWTNVNYTTDYSTLINGLAYPGTGFTPQVTFALDSLADGTNIQGIRVIGTHAGARGNGHGYLAVSDLEILAAPEPSTYALIGAGFLALLGLGRFVRRTA